MGINDETPRPVVLTGRVDTGLGPLQIHIVDLERTHRFDPNTVKMAVLAESLHLGKPLGPSDLSSEPGYLYRTHEVQILLTKGELSRLVLRRLQSMEARMLLKRFGEFFEIHDEFYDPATGEALQ